MKNYKKKELISSNGITLIALVITIIVLLILAGISISMLSGDNSILQKATDAKEQTGIGQEKETVALAYNSALAKKAGNGDSTAVTAGDLNVELANQGAFADESNPIIVIFSVSKRQYTVNSNGTIEYAGTSDNELSSNELVISIEITHKDVVPMVGGNVASVNSENIPIPTGFYAVAGTSKSDGFVISSVENDDLDNSKKGNQFVWVPVKQNQKLSLTVSSPENIIEIKFYDPVGTELSVGTVSGKNYTNETINPTINGEYKVVVKTASSEKQKKLIVRSLYAVDAFNDFWASEEGINIAKSKMNITDTSELFESISSNTGKTITTEEEFGRAFAKMMLGGGSILEDYSTSINTNGGFYVGRYESDMDNEVHRQSLIKTNLSGQQAMNRAKAFNGMSSLLTGEAWDRILDWIIEEDNNISLNDVLANSGDWGSYFDYYIEDGYWSAENTSSKANNIYDLAGNVWEYISQADYVDEYWLALHSRGGSIEDSAPAAERKPGSDRSDCGYRIALYL